MNNQIMKTIILLMIITMGINILSQSGNTMTEKDSIIPSDQESILEQKQLLKQNIQAKISASTALEPPMTEFSSYFGSETYEVDSSIVTDSAGNIIILGTTTATTLPNHLSGTQGKSSDMIIAKFDNKYNLLWTRLIGGTLGESAKDVTVDSTNNIIIVGISYSDDFPTKNAYNATFGGTLGWFGDGIVSKFSSSGTLLFSTYLGSENSGLSAVAIDSLNRIIVTGFVWNDIEGTFNHGAEDIILARFSSSGVLGYIAQIGSNSFEGGTGVAIASNNDIIVVGGTRSSSFPTLNAYDSTKNGVWDAFIFKISNATLTTVWSTFFGGSNSDDMAYDVDLDASGNVYIAGYTNTTDFPVLNAYDSTANGQDDVFIAKFSSTGILLWSTYLGGVYDDIGLSLVVDNSGSLYVAGLNNYPEWGYLDPSNDIGRVFLAKYSTSGVQTWIRYLDGNDQETTYGVTLDGSNNPIIIGTTASNNFPVTPSAYEKKFNGNKDIFITNYHSNGTLAYSTYFSGWAEEQVNDLTVDSQGNIISVGWTQTQDYPLKSARYYYFDGLASNDGFITKVNSTGHIQWSTLWGGGLSDDTFYAVTTDSADNVLVVGSTSGDTFRTVNAYDNTTNGGSDVIVAKFSSTGQTIWSTYLGGSQNDGGYGIAVDSSGNVFVTGFTNSANFPVLNAYDSIMNGPSDGFLTKFSPSGDLLWSTFIYSNANDNDGGVGVVVGQNQSVIVTGYTVTASTYNVFVDSYSNSGIYKWSDLITGNNIDIPTGVDIDSENNIVVLGYTYSTDFGIINRNDQTLNGSVDTFVFKIDSMGSFLWGELIGGNGNDIPYKDPVIDVNDNIIIGGYTTSNDFPLNNSIDSTLNGSRDGYLTILDSEGEMLWSSLYGGSGYDYIVGVGLTPTGDIAINGNTLSEDFPVLNANDDTYNGGTDTFIALIYNPFGDADNDGLINIDEVNIYHTDASNPDTDGDFIPDGIEVAWGLDPTNGGDAKGDLDNDGIPNIIEANHGMNGTDPSDAAQDFDQDGLTNIEELNIYNTDPNDPDTDNDGFTDGDEIEAGTDPLSPNDFPQTSTTISSSANPNGNTDITTTPGETIPILLVGLGIFFFFKKKRNRM